MTWAAKVTNPDIGMRLYVYIQGIGHVFVDGATPLGPAGTAWTAPTSKGYAYAWAPHALDVSAGVRVCAADIIRRSGSSAPASLTLALGDVARSTLLLGLFGRELSTGLEARITADVAYDTTGTGNTLTVDSTTGWAAAGYCYLGRETAYYGSKTATALVCTAAAGGARDVFSLGSCDIRADYNQQKALLPRAVTNYPSIWHGRYVRLMGYLVDVHGRALDTAIDGVHSRELYRGTILGDPVPNDDWSSWRVETRGIDAILQTEIGREPILGMLVQPPGDYVQESAALGGLGQYHPDGFYALWLIDDNTKGLRVQVEYWSDVANYNAGLAPTDMGTAALTLTTGLVDTEALRTDINTLLDAAYSASFPYLELNLRRNKSAPTWEVWTKSMNAGATQTAHRVTWFLGEVGSVGPLLGFRQSVVQVATAYVGAGAARTIAPDGDLAVYLHPDATSVPYFPVASAGQQPDLPPATGYARIGEEELIAYTGSAAVAAVAGMYQLTGVTRGAFGTPHIEHMVPFGQDWTGVQERLLVTFGVGFEDVTMFDALLRLAISTGSAHHGVHDTLAAKLGPGLAPGHFDAAGWAQLALDLAPWERNVSFWLAKPIRLGDLAAELLAPLGLYITARTIADGTYRITADRVLPPLESAASTAIGPSQLAAGSPADWQRGNDLIINRLTVHYQWDQLKGEPKDGSLVQAVDDDSMYEFGERSSVELKLRGYQWTVGEAIQNVSLWASQLFARFGRPYDLLRLHTDRTGWLLKPGDGLALTLAGAPTPGGTRGFTSRACVVVQAAYTYWDEGGEPGADLLVLVEQYWRYSTYSPSARVASAVGGGSPTITLTANAFTTAASGETDADHFENGDIVLVYNQGDWAVVDQRTLSGRVGNTFTLSGALTVVVGANTIMTPAAYAAVQALQRQHAFAASNATPPVLAVATTTAFRYV